MSLDPQTLPDALSNALESLQTFLEDYGWFVLIGSIALYVGYRYAYDYWHKKEVYHPDRVERLALGEREARLKQQLKWAKEAEKMHEETRGREQQALRKRNLKKFDSSQHKVKKGKDEWEEEADWLKGYKGKGGRPNARGGGGGGGGGYRPSSVKDRYPRRGGG